MEFRLHGPALSGWRFGGALAVSLVFHAGLTLAAVVLGLMLATEPPERILVIQEVFFGAPGADGSPGDGSAAEAGAAPAPAAGEADQRATPEPETPAVRIPPPATPERKRPVKPKSPSPAPAQTQAQAADTGQAGQAAQGHGTAAQGEGSGGGGNGGGRFEGEFGNGNGPRFSRRVQPQYPPHARRMGKEGVVVLLLRIDESGRLNGADVVEKAGAGFDEAALDAVRSSTYLPATQHGRPVPSRAILRIRFQLTAT